jgi:hypothetical protein
MPAMQSQAEQRVKSNENPRWDQAFSKDQGRTWETNWTMDFVRATQEMAAIQR